MLITPSFGVYQCSVLASKHWETPFLVCFLNLFCTFFYFLTEKYMKLLKSPKKMISTCKQHSEHPFAGWNTQHSLFVVDSSLIFTWSFSWCKSKLWPAKRNFQQVEFQQALVPFACLLAYAWRNYHLCVSGTITYKILTFQLLQVHKS